MLGISLVLLMLLFLFTGMPVAFALAVAGAIGLYVFDGMDTMLGLLGTVPFRSAAHYTLSTVPMFILMAQFISVSGIVDDVFTAAQRWLERLPGGLAITTIFAAAGMAAMSGSSTASAATLSTMAVPQMVKHGYSPRVATGVVTIAGTLAIMIPPSIAFVLYGIITETSIGRLLIAGIIPGILTAAMYCVAILVWSKVSPGSMPASTIRHTW
ncbi:MAG: TRAP transporter large permease subunit, partial [Gemmatimonadales bacterium]|nr:TRAP transporter large permease subunit [Gemmatimonadales bacterium]